jgi:hypothetical protein
MCLATVLVTSQEAALLEEKAAETEESHQEGGDRNRRSGDLIGFIGSKIPSAVSAFASASAGLSSLSAAPKHEYGPPVSYEQIRRNRRFKSISIRPAGPHSRALLATGRGGLGGCQMLRTSHCLGNLLTDGGKLIRFTRRPQSFTPQKYYFHVSRTNFC